MTEAERKAMEWLEKWATVERYPTVDCTHAKDYARTLKAMLARPVLPEEPSNVILEIMIAAPKAQSYRGQAEQIYRALYAHLTAPKTKTVWHVMEAQDGGRSPEHFDFDSIEDALGRARVCIERHRITVTIEPREVPA